MNSMARWAASEADESALDSSPTTPNLSPTKELSPRLDPALSPEPLISPVSTQPPSRASVDVLVDDSDGDLPPQSPDKGRSSPLLPPPTPPSSFDQLREIVFPRPSRRRKTPTPTDIWKQASETPLPPSPPPEWDFSNFENESDESNPLDGTLHRHPFMTPTEV